MVLTTAIATSLPVLGLVSLIATSSRKVNRPKAPVRLDLDDVRRDGRIGDDDQPRPVETDARQRHGRGDVHVLRIECGPFARTAVEDHCRLRQRAEIDLPLRRRAVPGAGVLAHGHRDLLQPALRRAGQDVDGADAGRGDKHFPAVALCRPRQALEQRTVGRESAGRGDHQIGAGIEDLLAMRQQRLVAGALDHERRDRASGTPRCRRSPAAARRAASGAPARSAPRPICRDCAGSARRRRARWRRPRSGRRGSASCRPALGGPHAPRRRQVSCAVPTMPLGMKMMNTTSISP